MTNNDIRRHYPSIVGEVVETYQKDGGQCAKVVLRNCHLELPLSLFDDAHLGDRISLEVDIVINRAHLIPHEERDGNVYFTGEYTD